MNLYVACSNAYYYFDLRDLEDVLEAGHLNEHHM